MFERIESGKPVLIYDGQCGLCHKAVRYVIDHDRPKRFLFAANTTHTGRKLLSEAGFAPAAPPDSMVLLFESRAYTHGDAALKIAGLLGGIHSLSAVGWLVPRIVRDKLYSLMAARRYRVFGRYDECRLPSPAERARFLDADEIAVPETEPATA